MDNTAQSTRKRRSINRWLAALAMLGLVVVSVIVIKNATEAWLIEGQGQEVTAVLVSADCESGEWTVEFEGAIHPVAAGHAAEECAAAVPGDQVALLRIPRHEELILPGANHRGRWLYGSVIGMIGVVGLLVIVFRGRKTG